MKTGTLLATVKALNGYKSCENSIIKCIANRRICQTKAIWINRLHTGKSTQEEIEVCDKKYYNGCNK